MTLKEYQEQAMTTCMDSSKNVAYMFLNLLGEVGELTEKVEHHVLDGDLKVVASELQNFGAIAKLIRTNPARHPADVWLDEFAMEELEEMPVDTLLHKELGDILWQLSGLCSVLGLSLEDIAQQNLDKLASRQKRNVIDGNGDNR